MCFITSSLRNDMLLVSREQTSGHTIGKQLAVREGCGTFRVCKSACRGPS